MVINAIEAVNENGWIKVRTEFNQVAADPSEKRKIPLIRLIVEDNGQGMSEPVRQRLFEPFFSTKMKGRGLGMAAVYGIVKNHGGWIEAHSKTGVGTTIEVNLPGGIEDQENKEKTSGSSGLPKTVLVIDDEEMVTDVLLAFLKKLGCRVLTAGTGQEAVEIAGKYKDDIDLALLDIELPDMGGHIVYRHLIQACPGLKVIVCSGYSLEGPVREVLESGGKAFLQKPFSYHTFSKTLNRVMNESIRA
jgi:CheY-like chemotaxis protein